MSDVIRYESSPLDERMRYAETLANAGDLIPRGLMYQPIDPTTMAARGPRQPSPGKILLVMETGAMLGLHPVAALQGIHVIEGKASLSASTMSAVVRQAGHDLKVWTEGSVAAGDFKAIATLVRNGEEFEYRSVWDADRATRAGLIGKDNWKNYFEAMCKNRAVSEVCRDGASDTLAGVIYTPDELGAEENDRGDVVVPDAEPAAPSAAAKKQPAAGKQGTRRAPKKEVEPEAAPVAVEVVVADKPEPSDAELKATIQARRAARESEKVEADPTTGEVVDAAEAEVDENIVDAEVVEDAVVDDGPAAVLDDADPAAPSAYELATHQSPTDYNARLAAATTVPQVKQVWDDATAADALTTDLRQAIITRKGEIEAAA